MFASDLHGSKGAAQQVVAQFHAEGAHRLILLGDLLYHGPRNPLPDDYDPQAVALLLNSIAEDIIAVRGNCDSEVDQMLLDFPIMSDSTSVLLENGCRFFVTHGHIFNQSNMPKLKANDVFVQGHVHIPQVEKSDSIWLFNPGSPTFPREGHVPTLGWYDDGQLAIRTLSGEIVTQAVLF